MTDTDSPAARYLAFKDRAKYPDLGEFRAGLSFELDPFQDQGCRALEDGRGVLVCAPTGAGKTVVGEFAVFRALTHGGKCFYTTPIKALSNQKYSDLVARHGADSVGLLTGDTSINSHAPIVVMTTEVLRNMLYADSLDLDGLTSVVMDEIHYLADKFRGAVWEEVILHLDSNVQLVGLSATVSNAEEFGAWLQEVRGHTTVVVDEHRPVPLWQHMMVGKRMYDLFSSATRNDTGPQAQTRIDPELAKAAADAESRFVRWGANRDTGNSRGGGQRGTRGGNDNALNGYRAPHFRPPARVEVIEKLEGSGLLPAITFIFSRAGCDAAVAQCVKSGMRLTTETQRAEIRSVIDRRAGELPQADLAVLGYWEWREALERGIAAHHAGLLPIFKETVEELFVAGLVKAVFATETLALGINMPARTVVLEKLTKYNGEGHADLTAGEYTQLTGRAGRRGIDVEGHAVVLWSPGMDPRAVAGLASKRLYPLRSSFRPSYNMAVNLTDRLGQDRARQLLEQSFAQFQSNAAVVGLARQVKKNKDLINSHGAAMQCHLGDIAEYFDLLMDLAGQEKDLAKGGSARRRNQTQSDLAALKRGDVIAIQGGRRSGLAVILDPGVSSDGTARPLLITEGKWAGRLTAADFAGPVPVLGRLRLAKHVEHRTPHVRRDIAALILAEGIAMPRRGPRRSAGEDADLAVLRHAIRRHPVHGCTDREAHLQWARRRANLISENAVLAAKVDDARDSLGEALQRILGLLRSRGYLKGDRLTDAGRMLSRIWSESDLMVAECLQARLWDHLDAPDLAAVVSALVFEARRDLTLSPRLPSSAAAETLQATVKLWAEVTGEERERGLPTTREPDLGFAAAVSVWVDGATLTKALDVAGSSGTELSAGDFVRWCRQVVDLLDQIQSVADEPLATTARHAVAGIRRGVVALVAS